MSDTDDFDSLAGRLQNENNKPVEQHLFGFDQPKPGLGEEILSLNMDPYADFSGRDGRYRGLSAGLSTGGMMPRPETPLMRFFKGKISQEELALMDDDELRAIMKKLVDVLGPLVRLIQERTGEPGFVRSALRLDDVDEMTDEEFRNELFSYLEFMRLLNKAASQTLDLNIIGALALRAIHGKLPGSLDIERPPSSD